MLINTFIASEKINRKIRKLINFLYAKGYIGNEIA